MPAYSCAVGFSVAITGQEGIRKRRRTLGVDDDDDDEESDDPPDSSRSCSNEPT